MIWLSISLATYAAHTLAMFIYHLSQAIAGWRGKATVKVVSVGIGPALIERRFFGATWRLKLFPLSGYTSFAGFPDEPDPDAEDAASSINSNRIRFPELPASTRVGIMLIGPVTWIVMGLCCVAVPIYTKGDQVVVDQTLPPLWKKNGVPNLTIAQRPSTWHGQWELLKSTVGEYLLRIATFGSLQGWGGYLAWLATLGSAGACSANAWLSCFGVTLIGLGMLNLLPIPPQCGGYIVVVLLEPVVGRLSESILTKATYVGFAVMLIGFMRVIVADLAWLA